MVNGVSRLYGEVSRHIFQPLYPDWPQREVPVGHVTNGVHVPSWDSSEADALWTKHCGKERWLGKLETIGSAIEGIDEQELWNLRVSQRQALVHYVRRRLVRQMRVRGAAPSLVERAEHVLDPNILTVGFARRFVEYKRPTLLLRDGERLARLLRDQKRPIQLIVAGKAHPDDHEGKRLVHELTHYAERPDVWDRVVFLEDYDMALAQFLIAGIDVWLNMPCRLWEACGTSGRKVLVDGELNLSELDGWWAEAYRPAVGWAPGDGREHGEPGWDVAEATQLHEILEQQVAPEFYERDTPGLPRAWLKRIRTAMSSLTPKFSSNRMLRNRWKWCTFWQPRR